VFVALDLAFWVRGLRNNDAKIVAIDGKSLRGSSPVIVDVAVKALAKVINDPATAVLAIDQLHRILRSAADRHLLERFLFDAVEKLRVIVPAPDRDDFVELISREFNIAVPGTFRSHDATARRSKT
jgi:hypothetical protein